MILRAVPPIVLLALFATLAVTSMAQKSITGDEVTHLPSGYTYVKTGDFRLNPQHPPLIKALAGLPLLFLDLKPVEETAGWKRAREWRFGKDFLVDNHQPIERIVFLGRLPMVCVGLFLGAVLFLWARELWGYGPGLLVLFLYSFSPNFLAHTSIVHTDVGVSAFTVSTLYLLWRFSRSGRSRLLVWCGVSLGLTLLAKYSGVVTVCIVAALLTWAIWWRSWEIPPVQPRPAAQLRSFLFRVLLAVILVALPAALVVAVGFDFPHGLQRWMNGFNIIHADLNPHWEGFLWGEYSKTGFWYYYLLAQLWKMPLPTLLCFAASLFLISARDRRTTLDWAFVLLPIAAFHGAAMIRSSSIGVRHVLPAFPFVFLACGATARWAMARGRWSRLALAAMCVWLLAGTLHVYPHFIPYFNGLAGGPDGGNRYLDDSNIEWGQDFYLLRDYIAETNPPVVRISAFAPIRPEHYGIRSETMTLRDVVRPQSGVTYFLGASYLQRNSLYDDYPGVRFHWLERYRPVDKIGWSIFVYRFSEDPADASDPEVFYLPRERALDDAIAALVSIVSRSPDFREARELLAETYVDRGALLAAGAQHEQAYRNYLSALQTAPGHVDVRDALRSAIEALAPSVEVDPALPASLYYREAFRQGEEGNMADAILAYLRCLRRDPDHLGAHFNLGQSLAQLGLFELAEAQWNEALRAQADYEPAMRSLQQARRLRTMRRPANERP
jgi:tetratricopeptide (TPR) repeat protein